MTNIFSNAVGNLVDVAADVPLLQALAELQANLAKLRDAGLGGSGATAVLLKILRTPADPAVVAALNAVGLVDLPARLAPLVDFVDRFENAGGGLFLEPLVAIDRGDAEVGSFDWKVIGGQTAQDFKGISLAFSGELALRFAADKGETSWTYSDRPGGTEHLLSIEASGKLKASAGFSIPFTGGSIGGEASADGSAKLVYLLDPRDPDRSLPVAALLARNLPKLPNPFSLQEVSVAVDTSDLVGVRLEVRGTTTIKAKVAIGFDEEIASGVKVTAGAEVSASATLTTGYELSVKAIRPRAPGASHQLAMGVSRHRLSERDIAFALGIEVDLAGLTARVREILVAKIGLVRGELESLRPYLSPGTLLREKLAGKLVTAAQSLATNPQISQALQSEAQALFGIAQAGSLQKFLEGQLTSLLEKAATLGTQQSAALADAIVQKLPMQLQALANQAQAQERLKAELSGLVDAVRAELQTRIGALASPLLDQITQLARDAGLAVTNAGSKADKAFDGLRKLADKIDALAGKIVEELNNPIRTQLKFKIAEAESRWDGVGLELSGTITAITADSKAIYKAVQTGDWQRLAQVFADGGAPGFDLNQEDSRLSMSMGRERTTSIDAIVIGFGAAFSAKDLVAAKIVVDGLGNVSVLAEGEVEKYFRLFGRKREVRFANAFAIAAASNASAASKTTSNFGFAIEQRDRKLRRREAEDFLRSMAALAGKDIIVRAGPVLDEWFGKGKEAHLNGILSLKVALSADQIERLRAVGERAYSDLTVRELILEGAIARTMEVERRRFDDVQAISRSVLNIPNGSPFDWGRDWPLLLAKARITKARDWDEWADSQKPAPLGGFEFFSTVAKPRIDRNQFVAAAQSLTRAKLIGDVADSIWRIVAYARAATPQRLRETLIAIYEQQERLVDISREWLTVGTSLQEITSSEVAERNVLLFELLSGLMTDPRLGGMLAHPLSPSFSIARSEKPEDATTIASLE